MRGIKEKSDYWQHPDKSSSLVLSASALACYCCASELHILFKPSLFPLFPGNVPCYSHLCRILCSFQCWLIPFTDTVLLLYWAWFCCIPSCETSGEEWERTNSRKVLKPYRTCRTGKHQDLLAKVEFRGHRDGWVWTYKFWLTDTGLSFQTRACIVAVHSVQFCLLSLPLACTQSSVGLSSTPLTLLLYCSRRAGKNRRIKHCYSGKVGPGGQCELAWEADGEYSWRSVTVSFQSSCSRDLNKAMGKRETDSGFPLFHSASVAQFWHDWATWKEAVPEGPYGAGTSEAD